MLIPAKSGKFEDGKKLYKQIPKIRKIVYRTKG